MAKKRGPGRPKLPENERKADVALRLRPVLINRIEAKAERTGHKKQEIIEETLEKYLDFSIGGQ